MIQVVDYILVTTAVGARGYVLYKHQKVRTGIYQSKEVDVPHPQPGLAPSYKDKKN